MESFLDALNDLIATAADMSTAELIGAMEITKQQLVFDLLTEDDDDEAAE